MEDQKSYDMGQDPKKLNDVGMDDKKHYPCLYDVNADNYPPLKDMKLGDTGYAYVEFKIAKGGGIEIQSMTPADSEDMKDGGADEDKEGEDGNQDSE